MSRIVFALAAIALSPLAAVGSEHMVHAQHASVSTYKPIQGFSHKIGERHFVGYFVVAQDCCAVTVIDATVARDGNSEGPRRQKFELPSGGRTEIKADHGKALGIGCSAGATKITVVALEPNIPESASR